MATSESKPQHTKRRFPIVLGGIWAVGGGLRLYSFLTAGSLWLDEIALLRNVRERDLWHLLFEPLRFRQVASVGTLVLLKASQLALGNTESAARLPSLLASLLALFALPLALARLVKRPAVLAATALFAITPGLVWYAADAKPYSCDLLMSVVLIGAGARYGLRGRLRPSAHVRLGLVASVALLFSDTSALIYAGASLASLVMATIRGTGFLRALRTHAAGWITFVIASLPLVWLHLRSVSASDLAFFRYSWSPGFYSLSSAESLATFVATRLHGLASRVLLLPSPWLGWYGLLTFAGLLGLLRGRRGFWLVALSLGVAVIASGTRLHPFLLRQLLFLTPLGCLAAVGTVDWLARWSRRDPRHSPPKRALPALASLVILLPLALSTFAHPPSMVRQDMKKVLEFVADHRQPGDGIFVYYTGSQAMELYGPPAGITASDYHLSPCDQAHPWRYVDDLHAYLEGHQRMWLVVAQPMNEEPELLTSYLDEIGARVAGRTIAGIDPIYTSSALLYDLNPDPEQRSLAYGHAGNRAAQWPHAPYSPFLCDGAFATGPAE